MAANSSPMDKYKKCMAANSLPTDKHKGCMPANYSPMDYPYGLSQERGSSDEMTAGYGGRQTFAGEMMVLQNDVRLPVSRPLRKK